MQIMLTLSGAPGDSKTLTQVCSKSYNCGISVTIVNNKIWFMGAFSVKGLVNIFVTC